MTPTGERVEPRLPLAEILDQVAAGRRVALVDVTQLDAEVAFAQLLEMALGVTVRRTLGDELIQHHSGGWLRIGTADAFRGHELDIAYAAVELRSRHDVEVLVPALAPTNGEIVWWER